MLSVSICIANYKQDNFLPEGLASCKMQDYENIELCVFNDEEGIGSGEAFNRAIAMAKGDVIVLLCADDVFTDKHVISDIVKVFETYPQMAHVSRWYHQFVDGDRHPVRAWRGENVIELANNPSGLSFRASYLMIPTADEFIKRPSLKIIPRLSNKMFVEAPFLVWEILSENNIWSIIKYDTVAVRVHKSTARSPEYYRKMWTSSPVEEWSKLGWKTNDFTHLIQVGVNFEKKAVVQEAKQFININFWNIFNPVFWFFFCVALCPRKNLYYIPEIYRLTWGRWTTREIKRK